MSNFLKLNDKRQTNRCVSNLVVIRFIILTTVEHILWQTRQGLLKIEATKSLVQWHLEDHNKTEVLHTY